MRGTPQREAAPLRAEISPNAYFNPSWTKLIRGPHWAYSCPTTGCPNCRFIKNYLQIIGGELF